MPTIDTVNNGFVFAASSASTAVVDTGGWRPVHIFTPSTFSGSALTVLGWYDDVAASLLRPVYNTSGAAVTWAAGSGRCIMISATDTFSLPQYLMFVSTASGASAASLNVIMRPV